MSLRDMTAGAEPVRELAQEAGQPGFHRGPGQHRQMAVLVLQFLAHQAQQVMLQAGYLEAQFLEAFEGQFADADCLQCPGGGNVYLAGDRVQPQQLAGQVKAHDLFVAFLVDGEGLDGAGPQGIDRLEGIAHPG